MKRKNNSKFSVENDSKEEKEKYKYLILSYAHCRQGNKFHCFDTIKSKMKWKKKKKNHSSETIKFNVFCSHKKGIFYFDFHQGIESQNKEFHSLFMT